MILTYYRSPGKPDSQTVASVFARNSNQHRTILIGWKQSQRAGKPVVSIGNTSLRSSKLSETKRLLLLEKLCRELNLVGCPVFISLASTVVLASWKAAMNLRESLRVNETLETTDTQKSYQPLHVISMKKNL